MLNPQITHYKPNTVMEYRNEATGQVVSDAEGNLIQRVGNGSTRSFAWDFRNRLTRVSENGGTIAAYTYDTSDRRSSIRSFTWDFRNRLTRVTENRPVRNIKGEEKRW
jgi:YD repeat-containing protein